MKKTLPVKTKPAPSKDSLPFGESELPSILLLTLSLLFFFKDWSHFASKVFLSLDMTVIYYPFYHWVHDRLAEGRLPLICDWAYHGAPIAAVSMVGVLSPFLWLFHFFSSFSVVFNLLFIAPHILYLFGTYFLGRQLGLSPSASILLAFLWAYNGHQSAQLDHLNVAWAHAFFPWAWAALLRYMGSRKFFWLLASSLLLSLCLLSGHPQVFFMECLFLLFWVFFFHSVHSLLQKAKAAAAAFFFAAVFSSPLLLFVWECLQDGGLAPWSQADRDFHSWTPLNLITLIFPWFFGKTQYDRAGGDYWWQYQFVEMQVAYSIAGLFFMLLFLSRKSSNRRFVLAAGLFALGMALGKFFFLYPILQPLPFFSFFRDPARYWFLATWVFGLGAAWAWESWFKDTTLLPTGKKISLFLLAAGLGLLAAGWFLLGPGLPLLRSAAGWMIGRFLLGDSLHTGSLGSYLDRLPEKLSALAGSLDFRRPRVFLPLLFLSLTTVSVFNRQRWNLRFQKCLLLFLVFADLMIFRMPLGESFLQPSNIPQPLYAAPRIRSLPFLKGTVSPLPAQYGEMAFPNMNFVFNRPHLPLDANPPLGRYALLTSKLGWFSWVYKDRDPLGFTQHLNLLRMLGVDQIVSDQSLPLGPPFTTSRNQYPFLYQISPVLPKASLMDQDQVGAWPDSLEQAEKTGFNPFQTAIFDSNPGIPSTPPHPLLKMKEPEILRWEETRISLRADLDHPAFLLLQKTYLPGWKASVNGKPVKPLRCDFVLTAIPLSPGPNQVELSFEPASLRLGFFLFLSLFSLLASLWFKRLLS